MFDFMDFNGSYDTFNMPEGSYVPEAIDCMRCGLCLSQCPTYQLNHDEAEGPRQRIRTLSRLVVEQEEVSEDDIKHLENCLQCRACETICPSKMGYSELYEQAQIQLSDKSNPGIFARFAFYLVANKTKLNALLPFVILYQITGLRWLLRRSSLLDVIGLSQADDIAPQPVLTSLKCDYATSATSYKGRVALFTGCIADRFDRETLEAAIKVLNHIGYHVIVPDQQSCCGAIHYHNGEPLAGKQLMQKNLQVFSPLSVDAIIFCATGCGSQLIDYQRLVENEEYDAQLFASKLVEISEFVDTHWTESITVKPCNKVVMVHEACSQRNVLKSQQVVYRLLNRVSGLKVSELADNHLCCGAGGSYMLTHPDKAKALRDLKINHLHNSNADYLVTSNLGCALHMATGRFEQRNITILHPITLLANHIL